MNKIKGKKEENVKSKNLCLDVDGQIKSFKCRHCVWPSSVYCDIHTKLIFCVRYLLSELSSNGPMFHIPLDLKPARRKLYRAVIMRSRCSVLN